MALPRESGEKAEILHFVGEVGVFMCHGGRGIEHERIFVVMGHGELSVNYEVEAG